MNKEILEQYTNEYKTIEEMSQFLNKKYKKLKSL